MSAVAHPSHCDESSEKRRQREETKMAQREKGLRWNGEKRQRGQRNERTSRDKQSAMMWLVGVTKPNRRGGVSKEREGMTGRPRQDIRENEERKHQTITNDGSEP